MSDDFDDDSFMVDDSFLREVDTVAAKAKVSAPIVFSSGWRAGPSRTTSLPSSHLPKQPIPPRSVSTAGFTSRDSAAPVRVSGAAARAAALASLAALPSPVAGPSRQALLPGAPSPRESGDTSYRPAPRVVTKIPAKLARTSSSGGLQIHLNFRKENQTTKGKRWDRTAFAESGRRIAGKGKGKEKAKPKARGSWDDDEEMDLDEEEEDDWDETPLAPAPKPFVDPKAPYEPQRHLPDTSTIHRYLYPTNRSKRDYQYEIVRACFTDNCLVALPTGLGKTFVAGVVMLNFYHWFPTGKIVFLAPTRPLVNQQIEACQTTCGIPSKDAAVMTGQSVSAKDRVRLWKDRRVFYCTPQTLDNDLKRGAVDPRDIVLAVFDEAHKASGSYAYTTILAYITAHHPYFRVLALTATPGADVQKVQGVVDALHISRIEIREAEAPEISKYMNAKETERHFVDMSEVIEDFRDRWAALMKPMVEKMVDKEILTERDLHITKLRTFRLTATRMQIARDRTSGLRWAIGTLGSLEKMARAMGSLLEFSIGMFHQNLTEMASNVKSDGKKATTKGQSNSLRNNFEFQRLLRDVEQEMNCIRIGKGGKTKADRHPKMAKTLELLLAHFAQADEDERVHGIKNDTRAMVFCSFRNPVLEIVEMLNDHPALLRATKFVGQSQGKAEEDKGFNQKEQKKTINDFKNGKFNVLVSTSIGEEGLDIGEVDFVIIYDMPKQSIKLLQRVGRTGRKRDGKVHVLMSNGREDLNWLKAQDEHREIQHEIMHSRNLELFEDVERLLPVGKFPECKEEFMDVDKWDPTDHKLQKEVLKLTKPRKSKKDIEVIPVPKRGHDIPDGAAEGFKSVAQLLRDSGRSINVSSPSTTAAPMAQDLAAGGKGKGKAAAAPLRMNVGPKGTTARKRKREPSPIRSESDDDPDEIEAQNKAYEALMAKSNGTSARARVAARLAAEDSPPSRESTSKGGASKGKKKQDEASKDARKKQRQEDERRAAMNRSAELFFAELENNPPTPPDDSPPPSSPPLVVAIREQAKLRKMPLSPPTDESIEIKPPTPPPPAPLPAGKLSPGLAKMVGFSQIADFDMDMSWNAEDDEEDDEETAVNPMVKPKSSSFAKPSSAAAIAMPKASPAIPVSSHPRRRPLGLSRSRPTPPSAGSMPPPPVPAKSSPHVSATSAPRQVTNGIGSSPLAMPEASQFPIRPVGRRRVIVPADSSSSERGAPADGARRVVESPLAGLGRLRRRVDTPSDGPVVPSDPASSPPARPPPRPRARGRGRRAPAAQVREYLDTEVIISGSSASEDESSGDENSQDRAFANDFAPTQAPNGYNQRAVYMAGLSTQAAPRAGLAFKQRQDKDAFLAKARKPVYISEDEGERSENEYELGSFVCEDDDDLGFETQSSAL